MGIKYDMNEHVLPHTETEMSFIFFKSSSLFAPNIFVLTISDATSGNFRQNDDISVSVHMIKSEYTIVSDTRANT